MNTPQNIAQQIDLYRQQLAKDPKSTLFATLAEALRRTGQGSEAMEVCRRGLGFHPDHPAGILVMAQLQVDAKQYGEAEKLLLGLLRKVPNHLLGHQQLLRLYHGLKRQPQAVAIASRLLKLQPSDPAAKAVLQSTSQVSVKPQPPLPTVTMAKLYEQQGHLQKAMEIYLLLAKQQPQLHQEVERLQLKMINQKKITLLQGWLERIREQRGAR